MATNIVLKRSATQGAVPSASDLALGEIALNTYDGKMYTKKTVSGTSSIVEFFSTVAQTSSAFDLINYKFIATNNQTSFSGNDANSVSLAYASGTIQVFLNGILLDPTDYTATNGTAVVLDTGASTGSILFISRFAGVNPFDDFKYVADANQTTFTGSDAGSTTLAYTVGNLAVYLNGVLLDPSDFTATNGTSVVLGSGAAAGDILHIHEFNQTGLTEVHADSSPTLGGDLDMHTFDLVTTDNRNIDIIPHGTGNVNLSTDTVLIGASGENVVVTSNGTGDMTVSTNSGTNSGTLKILDGANQNIEITPNGSGKINLDGQVWPNALGSNLQYLQTNGSGVLSWVDVLDTSEEIQDTVGAMFSSNTETGITATYQDGDGTIDLALVSRTIHGVAYDGSANIDLSEVIQDTVGAMVSSNTETNITVTYEDSDGTLDFVVDAAQPNVTSLGTLTALQVDNINIDGNTLTSASTDFTVDSAGNIRLDADGGQISFKDAGTTIGVFSNSTSGGAGDFRITSSVSDKDMVFMGSDGGSAITALTLDMSAAGAATFNDKIIATELDISGNVDIDGTLEADAITVNGTTLAETISDTVGAMVGSNTESGITVAYQDADNTLDFTVGTLNQNTTGTAATVTTAAQPNITSLGTLTTLTVDNITINGNDISSTNSDGDILFKGNDGGSGITALTLDMSDAGSAIFNHDIFLSDNSAIRLGAGTGDLKIYHDGSNSYIDDAGTGNLVLLSSEVVIDSAANIVLDADGGGVYFKDGGTTVGFLQNDSGDFRLVTSASDKDFKILGNDGGSTITALTLDMSAAGAATFNDKIIATELDISGNVDVDGTTNLDVVDIDGAVNMATTLLVTGNVDFNGDLDVDGTSNLDVVDIDGAVDMASTLAVTGILTAAGSANVARVGPIGQASGAVQTWNVSSAANTFFVPSDNNTVMNPGGTAVAGAIIQVEIAMGSTVYAIAWQNKFKFGGDGSTPTVTATANKTDIFTFRYNGTVWQEIGRVQNLAQTV